MQAKISNTRPSMNNWQMNTDTMGVYAGLFNAIY